MKVIISVTQCTSKTMASVCISKGQLDLVHRKWLVISSPIKMQQVLLSIKTLLFSFTFPCIEFIILWSFQAVDKNSHPPSPCLVNVLATALLLTPFYSQSHLESFLWFKSYGVTTEVRLLQQFRYFLLVLFFFFFFFLPRIFLFWILIAALLGVKRLIINLVKSPILSEMLWK